MSQKTYLIDGKRLMAEETKKLFLGSGLGEREKIALSMIDPLDHPESIIVDLGCLYGFFCKALREKFPRAHIIAGDYDEENLKISRFLHPEISSLFKQLNAYNLNLKPSSVDILTFQEVIEHLEGAAQAIKEISRVLKPGGVLILSTPTPYYWKDMIQCFKYELVRKYFKKDLPLSDAIYFHEHEWNRHIYCWTPSTLYTLLKVNGFEYVSHAYCEDGRGYIEKILLKIFPFFSPTIILKAQKVSEAPKKLV